jgi:acetate kinase
MVLSHCVAAINAGSSSIKFALFEASSTNPEILFRGQIDGIGVVPHLDVKDSQGNVIVDRSWAAAGFDQDAATREVLKTGASLISGSCARSGQWPPRR